MFGWLKRAGRLDDAEMLRTFNCGIGMIAGGAQQGRPMRCIAALAQAAAKSPSVIGEIEPGRGVKSQAKGKGEAEPCATPANWRLRRHERPEKRVAILISGPRLQHDGAGRGGAGAGLPGRDRRPSSPAGPTRRPAWAQGAGLPAVAIDHKRLRHPRGLRRGHPCGPHRAARRPRRARRLHAHPVGRLRRQVAAAGSSTSTPRCCPCSRACTRTSRPSTPGSGSPAARVHFVTEEMDSGPIVAQAAVPVLEGDTPETPGGAHSGRRAQALPARAGPGGVGPGRARGTAACRSSGR